MYIQVMFPKSDTFGPAIHHPTYWQPPTNIEKSKSGNGMYGLGSGELMYTNSSMRDFSEVTNCLVFQWPPSACISMAARDSPLT